MPVAGKVVINLTAGTSQFIIDMEKANRKLNEIGNGGASSLGQVTGAMRLLQGGVTTLISSLSGLAGGIIGGALLEFAKEALEAFEDLKNKPSEIAAAFNALNEPLAKTNASLQVQADHLQRQIDQLEHKPHNGIKDALDESIESSRRLSIELDKNFDAMSRVLKEKGIGTVGGFATYQADTVDIKDKVTGFQNAYSEVQFGAREKSAGIDPSTLDGSKQLAAIEDERKKAGDKITADLQSYLKATRDDARKKLAESNKVVPTVLSVDDLGRADVAQLPQGGRDQSNRLRVANELLDNTNQVILGRKEEDLVAKKKGELGNTEKAATVTSTRNPYEAVTNEIANLQSKVEGIISISRAAGTQNPFLEAMAKGAADADQRITALNNRLQDAKTGPKEVKPGDRAAILTLNQQFELTKAKQQQDATSVELLKEGEAIQSKLNNDIAAGNQKRAESLAILQGEAEAARILSDAEGKGAEASFQARERLKLSKIKQTPQDDLNLVLGLPNPKSTQEEMDRGQHAASIARTVAQLHDEAEARLANADAIGVEAKRRAELDQLTKPIRQDIDYLEKNPDQDRDGKLRGQMRQKLDATKEAKQGEWKEQDASSGRNQPLINGAKQGLASIVESTKYSAQEMSSLIGGAYSGINQQLGALLTGQKTSWGSFFQGMASQLAQLGMNSVFKLLFSSLGGLGGGGGVFGSLLGGIGKLFGGGKAEGGPVNSGKTYLVGENGPELFTPGAAGNITTNKALREGPGKGKAFAAAAGVGDSKEQMMAHAIAKKFGGYRAEGGPVNAGTPYMVGERGPELFMPGASGSIVPNQSMRSGGGGSTQTINVDARGATDPDLTSRNVRRAMQAVHMSAVEQGFNASVEMQRRRVR